MRRLARSPGFGPIVPARHSAVAVRSGSFTTSCSQAVEDWRAVIPCDNQAIQLFRYGRCGRLGCGARSEREAATHLPRVAIGKSMPRITGYQPVPPAPEGLCPNQCGGMYIETWNRRPQRLFAIRNVNIPKHESPNSPYWMLTKFRKTSEGPRVQGVISSTFADGDPRMDYFRNSPMTTSSRPPSRYAFWKMQGTLHRDRNARQ